MGNRLQLQKPDDVSTSDLFERRVGEQAFFVQILQEAAQRKLLIRIADIRSEAEFVLKFIEEFHGVVWISCQSVVTACGGQVTP